MRLNRKTLMGTVAAVALGGTMGVSTAAQAFDNVNWTWNQFINEPITKTVTINIALNPVGMIDDEIMQIQIGDVSAVSHVSGVYNWKPVSEQVVGVVGYKRSQVLDLDAAYNYDLHGGANFTSYDHQETKDIIRHDVNNSTKTSNSTTDAFRGKLDGELTVASRSNNPALFVGGAGAAGGWFSLNPSGGNLAGAGVIGAIGADAVSEGDASFAGELGGSLTQSTNTTSSTIVDNTTVNEAINDSSSRNGYTYGLSGAGSASLWASLQTEDITRIYGLYPVLQDATKELPKVESNATAVGNLISIESDVAVQEHSLQVVADTNCNHIDNAASGTQQGCNPDFNNAQFDLDADLNVNNGFVNVDSGNTYHDVALLTTMAAGAGLLKKADITAVSTVDDILNASVDSAATAIGNLKSIDVTTSNANNGLVIADITQVSMADVSAYSTVGGSPILVNALDQGVSYGGGINFVNYNHLGGVTLAKSTATAIGNVVNVGVNSAQHTAP